MIKKGDKLRFFKWNLPAYQQKNCVIRLDGFAAAQSLSKKSLFLTMKFFKIV